MYERRKNAHEGTSLISQDTQSRLAGFPEGAFVAQRAHCVGHVLGQSERNFLRIHEQFSLKYNHNYCTCPCHCHC